MISPKEEIKMTDDMPTEVRQELEEAAGIKNQQEALSSSSSDPYQQIVNALNTLAQQIEMTQAAIFKSQFRQQTTEERLMELAMELKAIKDSSNA
jgi:chromosome segregation ATPase